MHSPKAQPFPSEGQSTFDAPITLYRVSEDFRDSSQFQRSSRVTKEDAIQRFLNRTDTDVLSTPHQPVARRGLKSILRFSRMEVFSRMPPDSPEALRPRNLRLVIAPSEGALDHQNVLHVLPRQIFDRVVLPHDEATKREYIPAGEKQFALPLSPAMLRRMSGALGAPLPEAPRSVHSVAQSTVGAERPGIRTPLSSSDHDPAYRRPRSQQQNRHRSFG